MNDSSSPHYYVPANSKWPILTSLSLLFVVGGFVFLFNNLLGGSVLFLGGLVFLFYCMYGWWRTVSIEGMEGHYKTWEDSSFRWGMGWFIFSEVMFFACFFGALFYARAIAVPDLGSIDNRLLWPDYEAIWPTSGPYLTAPFGTIPAFGVPLLNTLILITSSVTVTWAHHALRAGNRQQLNIGLALTILLAIAFLFFQAEEYIEAYSELNLRLDSGIYGSTFFMLTGFHGFHVTVGTICLIAIFARCLLGHFSSENHFGFEAVAWYWHFVDVVWLLLFVLVYII